MRLETTKPVRWKVNIGSLRTVPGENFLQSGIGRSVTKHTKELYYGRVRQFVTYLKETKKPYALESYLEFLAAIYDQGAKGTTLWNHRSALVFVQRMVGDPKHLWAEDRNLRLALEGYRYEHRLRAVPRGTITVTMLKELCSLDEVYGVAFRVVFYGVLRKGQLEKLRSGDYKWDGDVGHLTLRQNKRVNARTCTKEEHTVVKTVYSSELKEVLIRLQALVEHGRPLFAWVEESVVASLMLEAAERFRWPKEVFYDGLHVLRHGGSFESRRRARATEAQEQDECMMSANTLKWYSRSMHERLNN